MGLWYLWRRYQPYGVDAIFDAERRGRPPVFSPLQRVHIARVACTDPAAYGLHLARWDCRSLQQVVVEQAIGGALHSTTIARIVADASLQPHRSRDWKTATIDERFTTRAAKILWRYERVEWLYDRGEVGLCRDEKPPMQVVVRGVPTQPMRRAHLARREVEYTRHGTVTVLVALNVYEGRMWGRGLAANDHAPCLGAVRQLTRCSPRAQRLHLIMDHGASQIAHETRTYFATHPRLRVFSTPPHASWRNQAELLLRALSDKSLDRFDPHSRQHFMDHRNASWPEDNQRFARPFDWSWTCRDLDAWARKKATFICTKTYATVH